MTKVIWELPIRTISEANSSEHWKQKSQRHRRQQFFVKQLYMKESQAITLPCIVTMIRLGPRILDDDNLASAFKYIRDEISECLIPEKRGVYVRKDGKLIKIKGRADSDPRIKWQYAQEKCPKYGIRIEIEYD
jgi:hypothetical protein